MERIWGGRKLADLFGKELPAGKRIGESWEIVDRPEAQSIVARGPLKGNTLHELWTEERSSIFGEVHDAPRFPLLIKLLDAHDRLSLQVHPPVRIARKLGGEPKTEFWYVAAADTGAELLLGLHDAITRDQFETALREGTAADYAHKVRVKPGDTAFLPAGRLHAISPGNLLIEIQQNSDTTYRVFDWNRVDAKTGRPRDLHVEQALASTNFGHGPVRPIAPTELPLPTPAGGTLRVLDCPYFRFRYAVLTDYVTLPPIWEGRILIPLRGKLTLSYRAAEADWDANDVALIPSHEEVVCVPEGAVSLLEIQMK